MNVLMLFLSALIISIIAVIYTDLQALIILLPLYLIVGIGAVFSKTLRFTSLKYTETGFECVKADNPNALERLAGAIRFKTVSYEKREDIDKSEFSDFIDFIRQQFPIVHSTLKYQTINGYSLVYEWEGSNPALNPVLMLAHYDVVPVEAESKKDWLQDPFKGHISDGFIWGRGALDDKSSMIALLEAAEELIKSGVTPERSIFLAFGHDEEIGGQDGAVKISEYFKSRGLIFEYAIDEGLMITNGIIPNVSKPVAMIGIAEKGYLSLELTASGSSGHSSMPHKETAIGVLVNALRRIERNQFPARVNGIALRLLKHLAHEMPYVYRLLFANLWLTEPIVKLALTSKNTTNALIRTTVAPTMLEGSIKENVLPGEAKAVVNIRIIPGENIDSVIKRISKVLGKLPVKIKRLDEVIFNPASISDDRSNSFKMLQRTISCSIPNVITAPSMALSGSDSRHYAHMCKDIYRFVPIFVDKDDTKRIHGVNERIAVENYKIMINFYINLLLNSMKNF